MKINIKATDILLADQLRSYLEEKLLDAEKFLGAGQESAIADIELGRMTRHHRQGEIFKAEIHLHFTGRDWYAAESAEDLYAAIDQVKDEIIRQLRSASKRKMTLLRRGGRLFKDILRGLRRGLPKRWR